MLRTLLFLVFLIPFLNPAQAQDAKVTVQPGRVVFKLKPEFRQAVVNGQIKNDQLARALAAVGAYGLEQKYPRTIRLEGNPEATDLTLIYQLKLNEKSDFRKIHQQLAQTGMFTYVEQLRNYEPLYLPNDPRADSLGNITTHQYHLKRIRAYRGWDFEKGDSTVVIGILDTGTRYNHQDLKASLKKNYADPIDGIDNDNDGYIDNHRGWDLADNDNDATADANGHGVAVTGAAAATTDNGKLVAGVGFKSRYLPVKIFASTPTGNFSGYEGIVYAADHGCNIINLSWGGYATPSAYELDVITYAAVNRNAVIVAAAGNTNGKLNFFPSSYRYVLAVGGLRLQNNQGNTFTYSYYVDVVAPAEQIVTTWSDHDSAWAATSGSSLACPQVSGTAALVKRKFPQYNAEQIIEQIRTTANDTVYRLPVNSHVQNLLGKGILDVAKALATTNAKSVRYINVQSNKGENVMPTDTINLIVDFRNYLAPLSNLSVALTSASPYVTILQGAYTAGAMATLTNKTNTVPFQIKVAANVPVNESLALRFTFTDGTYTDYQYYELILNPDYVTIDINKLAVTLTSTGNIGYKDLDPQMGNGVRYRKANLLAEGGLMVGNAPTAVSDNIRFQAGTDTDFYSVNRVHFVNNIPRTDILAEGMMRDSFPQSAGTLGIQVDYKGYAWQNAPNDKFVILEYVIKNLQATTLTNLYAGMFADWDIFDSGRNRTVWDATNKMGYVYNVNFDTLFTGIKLLSSGVPSFYAVDNYAVPPGTINISDGFTNAEKFQALSGGVARTSAGALPAGNDVSYVIGEKLPDLAPNAGAKIALAILAGDDLADIQASAQAAQTMYTQLALGTRAELAKNWVDIFPNPVSDQLHIRLPSAFNAAETKIEIYNALGKSMEMKTMKSQGGFNLNVATLANGLYVMKISNSQGVQTHKIQVLK